jgi:hypothetical protein
LSTCCRTGIDRRLMTAGCTYIGCSLDCTGIALPRLSMCYRTGTVQMSPTGCMGIVCRLWTRCCTGTVQWSIGYTDTEYQSFGCTDIVCQWWSTCCCTGTVLSTTYCTGTGWTSSIDCRLSAVPCRARRTHSHRRIDCTGCSLLHSCCLCTGIDLLAKYTDIDLFDYCTDIDLLRIGCRTDSRSCRDTVDCSMRTDSMDIGNYTGPDCKQSFLALYLLTHHQPMTLPF